MKAIKIQFILSLLITLCKGQTTHTETFNYDSKNNKIVFESKKCHLKHNNDYTFKLKGIQSTLHEVSIQPVSYSITSTPPDILTTPFPFLKGDEGGSISYGITQSTVTANEMDILVEKVEKVAIRIETIVDNLIAIKSKLSLEEDFEKTLQSLKSTEILNIIKQYDLTEVNSKNAKITMSSFNTDMIFLQTGIELLNKYSEKGINPEYAIEYFKITNIYNIYNTNKDQIKQLFQIFANACNNKTEKSSENYSNKNDFTEVNIIIKSRLTGDTLLKEIKDFYTVGYWRIDFSTGLFFNGIISKDYYIDTTKSNLIQEDVKMPIDVSIGGMANFCYVLNPKFRFGPSIGVALSPFDEKTRYTAGLSAIVGKRKLACVSLGTCYGKYKTLSDKVANGNGEPKENLPRSLSEIPTVDKYKFSWYLSVTFNLTPKKTKSQ